MVLPPERDATQDRWQTEADLLALGREWLEQWCQGARYRHLYPDGPHFGVLLAAYQELERRRLVGRVRATPRARRRAFKRLLRRAFRGDTLDRNRRLAYHYPEPRLRPLPVSSRLLERALASIDADARAFIEAHVLGNHAPWGTVGAPREGLAGRGFAQFQEALLNEALRDPDAILALHPQALRLLSSTQPRRRRHPIASYLLVKLPLKLIVWFVVLFNAAYVGAYFFFNDEVLGAFVSQKVSGLLEGELEMRSIHWRPRLLFDLLLGQPSPITVEDVTVWEPYKSVGLGERQGRAAYAEQLDVRLVLHEIIPWNRLGVPTVFEIPWVLHFTQVETDRPTWFSVRAYEATTTKGETVQYIGLRDAFRLHDLQRPPSEHRGLSFAVDDARLAQTEVLLDFPELDATGDLAEATPDERGTDDAETAQTGWAVFNMLTSASLSLAFDAPPPDEQPVTLPFTFELSADGQAGWVRIKDITTPYTDLELEYFASGTRSIEPGAIGYRGALVAAGSPLVLEGVLRDALNRWVDPADPEGEIRYGVGASVVLEGMTSDVGPLAEHVVTELGLPPQTVVAPRAPATFAVEGPLSDPAYRITAQGLSLDLIQEPAWIADDVAVNVTLARQPVPRRWRERLGDAVRMVATFETFQGLALGGSFKLPALGEPATVVFPELAGEPWLIAADTEVASINPARLVPNDPDLQPLLAGAAKGEVRLERLVIPPADEYAPQPSDAQNEVVFSLQDLEIVRDRGPQHDHLPKRVELDGRIALDESRLELENLIVGIDGARLRADGAVDLERDVLAPSVLDLQIDDGLAFANALAIPPLFERSRAQMDVFGPVFAPSSRSGSLYVRSLGGGEIEGALGFDAGVLELRSNTTEILGGEGRIELDAVLFERGRVLSEPKLHATARLDGVAVEQLVADRARGVLDLDVEIGDGNGRAAPFSKLRASGRAKAPQLSFAGTRFKNAQVWFRMTRDELSIDSLSLPIHIPVSPGHAPKVTVPVGRITGDGTIGLGADNPLDLLVHAQGVPVDVVTRALDVDLPVRGQLGRGTQLRVGGRLTHPLVDGTIRLLGVSVADVALGTGTLDIASDDVPASGPLAAHRELRVRGEVETSRRGPVAPLQWTVDAVIAIGSAAAGVALPIEAELDVDFSRVELPHLLDDPLEPGQETAVHGGFEGVVAHALTCDTASPMLSACSGQPPRDERSLALRLDVDKAWISGSEGTALAGNCDDAATLCSQTQLSASIDWPIVRLEQPWVLATGGATPSRLELDGSFDVSQTMTETQAQTCTDPVATLESSSPAHGTRSATVRGDLDLASIEPLLSSLGLDDAAGKLSVDLSIMGSALSPRIQGRLAKKPGSPPIALQPSQMPVPLRLDALELQVQDRKVLAEGQLAVLDQPLRFGSLRGRRTGFVFAGQCAGRFDVAAEGTLSGALIDQLAGDAIEEASGAVDIDHLAASGTFGAPDPLQTLTGSFRFDQNALRLRGVAGFSAVDLERGRVDVARCDAGVCPPGTARGWFGVFFGGRDAVRATARPSDALRARIDGRGNVDVWGPVYVSPDLQSVANARVNAILTDIPYRHHDSRGRPVLDVEISSKNIALRGGAPLVLSGDIALDRARYVKDAIEGVDILRFADEVDTVTAPPPELIATTQLDLRLETQRPLRVENNVATGVEADLLVDVTGTYEQPEFSGRIDVEPGGEVDLPFLTGTYEIQRGRVTLLRELSQSEVDVVALRREPVYIDDQPRQVQLLLRGPLSAIRPSCTTEGDAPNALDTVRGCTEYLVLGAGDVRVSENDVQRFGGGGLANARKPLQVVGHLTELDLGERAAEALPRLRTYIPQMRLRLGQIGPELEVDTPVRWFDFDYGWATLGWHYTRGYPGFLLRQSRDLSIRLQILEPMSIEFRRQIRSYLNERIVFDPLEQQTIELKFDFQIPSLR